MKNRISKYIKGDKSKESEDVNDIRTFFLACEFKPKAEFWNIIEDFAYNIKPAFIYGSLGIITYEPAAYSIVEANDECQPLLGYIMTITHPETIMLLDRIKGYLGENSFNTHVRKLVTAYTDIHKSKNAWCYTLSNNVINAYQQIEAVEFGMWDDNDEKQVTLLEKIIEAQ
jgi:hypothetical protein